MVLTDTHIRNAKPRAKPYKLSDGGGMYLLVKPDGARYWRLDYRFSGNVARSLSASIQQQRSPTRVLAARKHEHYWRKTPSSVTKKAPNGLSSSRAKPLSRSSLGNDSTISARDWSPGTAGRSSLDWRQTFSSNGPTAHRRHRRSGTPRNAAEDRKAQCAGNCPAITPDLWAGVSLCNRDRTRRARSIRRPKRRTRLTGQEARPQGNGREELPKFLSALEVYDGDRRTSIALRLIILTFVRTSELRAARWSEFEGLGRDDPLWRIPAERMKMKREHIVPLVPQVVTLLRDLRALPWV